jgi:hypothetical protein
VCSRRSPWYKNHGRALAGLRSFFEAVIIFIRDEIARKEHRSFKYERYVPYSRPSLLHLVQRLLGLMPGAYEAATSP